jgi:hypothetical protein
MPFDLNKPLEPQIIALRSGSTIRLLSELKVLTAEQLIIALRTIPAGVTKANLRYNFLGDRSVAELTQALEVIPEDVTFVDLFGNDLGKKSGAELAQALGVLPASVTLVDLRANGLDSKSDAELDDLLHIFFSSGKVILIEESIQERLKKRMEYQKIMNPVASDERKSDVLPLEQKHVYDTPLHVVIRSAKTAEEIEEYLKKEDDISLDNMAKTVNNNGELPIFILHSKPFEYKKRDRLRLLLLPFTLPKACKPFSENINPEVILAGYSRLKEPALYVNLELGCQAVNAARSLFTTIPTHPDSNKISRSLQIDQGKLLKSAREEYWKEVDEFEKNENKSLPIFEKNVKFMKHKIQFFSKRKLAACDELSYAILNHIYMSDKNKIVEIWKIPSNDHIFVIIEPHTPDAVICDGIAGDVFPATQLLKHLKSFYLLDVENYYYILYAHFNPNCHYIEKYFSYLASSEPDSCIKKYMAPNYDFKIIPSSNNINKPFFNRKTLLLNVIQDRDIDRIKLLLSKKADPEIKSNSKYGDTALINAAKFGYNDIIRILLEAKASTELTDNPGQTPLFHAVYNGKYDAAKTLLEAKADPNHGNFNNGTPLFHVKENEEKLIPLLVEYNANINHSVMGMPLLIHYGSNLNVLQILLKLNINVNQVGQNNMTLLYLAAHEGWTKHVELLLSHKADPTIKFKGLFTPLYIAKENQCEAVIQLLEKREPCIG